MDLLQIFHHFLQFPPADILEGKYHTQNGNVNCQQIELNSKTAHYKIDLTVEIERKQPWKLSEIFFSLLGCHREFLLDNLRRGRPFSHEDEFEVEDDFIDNFVVFDEAYDTHMTYVSAKKEGTIYFASMATTTRTLLLFCIFYLCGQMIPCKWISCFGQGSPRLGRYTRSKVFDDVGRAFMIT